MHCITKFLFEEQAATAVEYAVMLAMILMVVLGAVSALGGEADVWWGGIRADLDAYDSWGGD